MGSTVLGKVVGFRDVERHALNTVFRVSAEQPTCYALWTPEAPVMPHIALILFINLIVDVMFKLVDPRVVLK